MSMLQVLPGLLNFGSSMASNAGTALAGLMAYIQNQQRYDAGSSLIDQYYGGPMSSLSDQIRSVAQMYNPGGELSTAPLEGQITQNARNLFNKLEPLYKDRWTRNMGYIENAGEQQKRDIQSQFDAAQSASKADLLARGMSGTTITPSVTSGIERQRSNALGTLQESLNQQRFAADTSLSADYANALSSLTQGESNAGLQAYNLRQGGVSNWLGMQQGLNNNAADQLYTRLNWMTGVVNPYPSQQTNLQLNQALGQGVWPAADLPSADSGGAFWNSLAGGGIGAIGTVGGWKIMTGGCLSSDSEISMADGTVRPLRDVGFGDKLLGGGEVLFRDCGEAWPERKNDYVVVLFGSGKLVCTKDHIIDGKPAGELIGGDIVSTSDGKLAAVLGIQPHPAVTSGDFILKGADWYYANGFKVKSMMARGR